MQLFHFSYHMLIEQFKLLIQTRSSKKDIHRAVRMPQMITIPIKHVLVAKQMCRKFIVVVEYGPLDKMADGIIHIDSYDWFSH
ncbi:hypothetical protein D3C80_1622020 [compost metagenome]